MSDVPVTSAATYMSPRMPEFLQRVHANLEAVRDELGEAPVLPVALLLVVDEKHGGDSVAQEAIKREALLDRESGQLVDFHYLGWSRSAAGLCFDLDDFESWRAALKDRGVSSFGWNADFILVDTELSGSGAVLRFDQAIHFNLSEAVRGKRMGSAGEFFGQVIAAVESVRLQRSNEITAGISDKLGLIYATESLLTYVADRLGKFVGVRRLVDVSVRRLGPPVSTSDLYGSRMFAYRRPARPSLEGLFPPRRRLR